MVSTVTTKVEGLDYTNGTGNFSNAGIRVWDSSDYVIPPQVSSLLSSYHLLNVCSLLIVFSS